MTITEVPAYPVSGVNISALNTETASRLIVEAAVHGNAMQVHLCNAYTLSLVDKDVRLEQALKSADLNLADGTPVAWLGRRHGVQEPVRGPSLMRTVTAVGAAHELRHYLYGGAPGVAAELAVRLGRRNQNIDVVGLESPAYEEPTDSSVAAAADRIRSCGANVVWVGLGTPRQDYVVPMLAERLPGVVVIPVGAAFDFLTDRVKEAPSYLRGTGLEWAHRLVCEPRRLFLRYLLGNPRFVWSVIRHLRDG